MKYYIKIKANVITMIGSSRKVQSGCVEITKAKYDEYKSILASIPNKAGYTKKVTLYVDGTYEVEYIEIVEIEEDDEE